MNIVVLGTKYVDSISGFTGVATARADYLNGCTQVQLTPNHTDGGKLIDTAWFDEPQLKTETGEPMGVLASVGGPRPTPPNRTP